MKFVAKTLELFSTPFEKQAAPSTFQNFGLLHVIANTLLRSKCGFPHRCLNGS